MIRAAGICASLASGGRLIVDDSESAALAAPRLAHRRSFEADPGGGDVTHRFDDRLP